MKKKNGFKTKVTLIKTLFGTMCIATIMAGDAYAADIGLAASIGGDDSAIAIPIRTEGYLIQPELSYQFYEDVDEDQNYESEGWSLGVFGYKRVAAADNLEALFGIGLGYTTRDHDDRYRNYHYKGSSDGYFIAPAIGLSYNVSDNISFAIEARYRYDSADQENRRIDNDPNWPSDETEKSDYKRAYTDTRVTLRYYFAGI